MSVTQFLQFILILSMTAMALLAIFYLRRRRLAWYLHLLWGLVAVFIPFLGPFLVIACRPGVSRYALR